MDTDFTFDKIKKLRRVKCLMMKKRTPRGALFFYPIPLPLLPKVRTREQLSTGHRLIRFFTCICTECTATMTGYQKASPGARAPICQQRFTTCRRVYHLPAQ